MYIDTYVYIYIYTWKGDTLDDQSLIIRSLWEINESMVAKSCTALDPWMVETLSIVESKKLPCTN